MDRLTGVDVQHQARRLAALYVTFDLRLVIAQGLCGLARLFFGATTEAQQGFFIAIAEATDIAFYIGLQFIVGRFDPHIQFTLRQRRAAGDQHQHATGKSSGKLHSADAITSLGGLIEPDLLRKFYCYAVAVCNTCGFAWKKTRVQESALPPLRRFPHSPDVYRTPDNEDSRCRGSRPVSAHRPRTSYGPLAAIVRRSACPGIADEPPSNGKTCTESDGTHAITAAW